MLLKLILVAILAFVVRHGYFMYTHLDYGRVVYNHYPGSCHQVEGVDYGSENMYILPNGMTFITSGFSFIKESSVQYVEYYQKHKIKGRIFLFNLKNPQTGAQEMKLTSTKDFDRDRFRPHGISGWEDKKSGKLFLFVVNHERDGQERVEKFVVSMETLSLTHVKSYFGDPTFGLLNDIAATGEDSFYFSNLAYMTGTGFLLEALLLLSWGNIGYYSSGTYRTAVSGIMFPNGIYMSRDGRYIFLVTARDLRIFDRAKDSSLQLQEIYPLASAPDNVVEDPVTGDLYVALHPVSHLTMNHMDNPEMRAPSQVLQVKLKDGSVSSVTELFIDDGNLITASTVAVVYNRKLLIGSIIDKLVLCDVSVPL